MENKIFNEEELKIIHRILPDFNYSEKHLSVLDSEIADLLEIEGFDLKYNPTKVGIVCESILDKLAII